MKTNYILAIETSCDDTSMAIVKNQVCLGEATQSSLSKQVLYGGIVPEVAAREHALSLDKVYAKVLKQSKIAPHTLNYIAYTSEPGLVGCLHTGKVFAKTLAYLLDLPLLKIHHLYGHIYSAIVTQKYEYPLLALIASGGHTGIYLVKSPLEIITLNETSDDAIGETLDKIGRMLNLPYPGGISIDQIYDKKQTYLKLLPHQSSSSQFSFSGIKTATLNYLNTAKMKKEKVEPTLIASSVLKWVIDDVISKLKHLIDIYSPKMLVIGGGVSANQLLRSEVKSLSIKTVLPPLKYTGDNAVMIGLYANELIKTKF